jgi:hypothetical protein
MSNKIILGELHQLLFPEHYPYYTSHFETEKQLLSNDVLSDTAFQNICFKVKVTRYCLKVKDPDARMVLSTIFNKHVETYFDWHKEYDWFELKSILFYFLLFSQAQHVNDIFSLLKNKTVQPIFKKYLPLHNQLYKLKEEEIAII